MESRQWWKVAAGAGAAGLAAWQVSRYMRAQSTSLPEGPRQRVVVLGAGFGGISFLDELHRRLGRQSRLDVLLVDRNNFNLFSPMLYQVSTGLVDPDNITYPLRTRVREAGARFQESVVHGIDIDARRVDTDDGPIPYDILVVALGSVTNFFGMERVARRSLTLKTLGDGITLRNRIIDVFEQADVIEEAERRRELLTFNIVGAGATGIELATSIDNLVHLILLRDYPNVHQEDVHIRLIEALDRAAPEMSPDVSKLVTSRLLERGIGLLLNTSVVDMEGDRLRTRDGSLLAPGTTIWTAGVRANPTVAELPGEHGRGGRIVVNEFLQMPDHPEVFCIGDNTSCTDPSTGRPAPPNAPAAIQMAQLTAANIERSLRGQPLEAYHYVNKGELLSLGRNQAIVHIGNVLFNGFPAWIVWRAYYIGVLMGWENRVGVLADWSFAYFARRRESARLSFEPALMQEAGVVPEIAGMRR